MFILKVQVEGKSIEHESTLRFHSLEQAQGALHTLKWLGETRQLEIVRRGRPAHDERQSKKPTLPPMQKAELESRKSSLPPPIKRTVPPTSEESTLTLQQVAALVAAIQPSKTKSGEYHIDFESIRKMG